MTDRALNAELLAAHARSDGCALAELYQRAAAQSESEDARGFFLVHAYVFALETGHPDQGRIRDQLWRMNREL